MNYQTKVLCWCSCTCMCFSQMWAWFIRDFAFMQGTQLWTPLLLASNKNHIDVLELLIQHGAQLDVRDQVSVTVTIILSTHYCALINC